MCLFDLDVFVCWGMFLFVGGVIVCGMIWFVGCFCLWDVFLWMFMSVQAKGTQLTEVMAVDSSAVSYAGQAVLSK